MNNLLNKLNKMGYIIRDIDIGMNENRVYLFNSIGDMKGSFIINDDNRSLYSIKLTGSITQIKKIIKLMEEYEDETI